MSDLREVLVAIRNQEFSSMNSPTGDKRTTVRLINAIVADGRITLKEEPMTTPDPDSAADHSVEDVIASGRVLGLTAYESTCAVLDFLHKHPEAIGFPVMTESEEEAAVDAAFNGKNPLPQPPYIIIPDPDPPAASVPELREQINHALERYGQFCRDNGQGHSLSLSAKQNVLDLVEAANGGGAK